MARPSLVAFSGEGESSGQRFVLTIEANMVSYKPTR